MIALFLFMPTQQDKKKHKYNPPYDCLGAKFFALMVEKFIKLCLQAEIGGETNIFIQFKKFTQNFF